MKKTIKYLLLATLLFFMPSCGRKAEVAGAPSAEAPTPVLSMPASEASRLTPAPSQLPGQWQTIEVAVHATPQAQTAPSEEAPEAEIPQPDAPAESEGAPTGSPEQIPKDPLPTERPQLLLPAEIKPDYSLPDISQGMSVAATPGDMPAKNEYTPLDSSKTEIGMMTQEYLGMNIAEIPMIVYDSSNPQLDKFSGHNFELDSINDSIMNSIQRIYDNFKDRANLGSEIIEIRAYPFTSSEFLQFVVTSSSYPSYGTDGDMFSVNYYIYYNRAMSIEDVLSQLRISKEELSEKAKLLYAPETPGETVKAVDCVAFLLNQGPDRNLTRLLLQVQTESPEAGSWKRFYQFTPETIELKKLNPKQLFNPSEMDQKNPPLSYAR
ncbi:MAG: hypothetical protein LBU32_07845 [Clostridiales bacterium]|jgi:hypothetical protein|nr:hypothetical protein [Clostridiales bacterium]